MEEGVKGNEGPKVEKLDRWCLWKRAEEGAGQSVWGCA